MDSPPLLVLTRPRGRNAALARRLAAEGQRTLILPLLRVAPLAVEPRDWPDEASLDLVVFVSRAAAFFYFSRRRRLAGSQPAWPRGLLAATVGASSGRRLAAAGVVPADQRLQPGPGQGGQDSEALWALLQPRLPGLRRALIVRGEQGREWLGERLEAAGVSVTWLALYRREPCAWPAASLARLAAALREGRCRILVTSGESAMALVANLVRGGLLAAAARARFVAVHERIAERLQSAFEQAGIMLEGPVEVCEPDDESLFRALRQSAARPVPMQDTQDHLRSSHD